MKKILFVAFISVFALVAWVTYPQIVQKYRENFAVDNVTVKLRGVIVEKGLKESRRYVTSELIGTLKMHQNGAYYLEATDIPDRYFDENGKILIKVDRFGYEKPAIPIYYRENRLGNVQKIHTTDYRLCTKAEAIKLIDDNYKFKLQYAKLIEDREIEVRDDGGIYRTNSEVKVGVDGVRMMVEDNISIVTEMNYREITYPEGKKPFFDSRNLEMAIATDSGRRGSDGTYSSFYFIMPSIPYYGYDYDKLLSQAKPCFTPYKVRVYDTDEFSDKAKAENSHNAYMQKNIKHQEERRKWEEQQRKKNEYKTVH